MNVVLKKATSNTVVEYIQRVKIEAAKKSLENSRKSINEVMYDVGYNDTKAFRVVFKKNTGMTVNGIKLKKKIKREIIVPEHIQLFFQPSASYRS